MVMREIGKKERDVRLCFKLDVTAFSSKGLALAVRGEKVWELLDF
jgi:hypothetical protein